MKNIFVFFTFLTLSLNSFARLSDGKVHLALNGAQLIGTVDKGFHFNREAPAGLRTATHSVVAEKKEENEIIFDVSKVENQSFTANFYVCDDKKTVCEEHNENFKIVDGKLQFGDEVKSANAEPAAPAMMKAAKALPMKKNVHGFYIDNLAGALSLAQKNKSLVLVDFNAPWCPSCIRLETEVFTRGSFQNASRKLVRVSVNIDKASSKDLSQQYHVVGIPTLIILNAQGEELSRFTDYRPTKQLVSELKMVFKSDLKTTAELKKKAEAGDISARQTLGERAFAALNYEEAVQWLSPLPKSLLLANSEVNLAQSLYNDDAAKNSLNYQAALEKWIAIYPQTLEAIQWRNEVLSILKGEGKEITNPMHEIAKVNSEQINHLLSDKTARAQLFKATLVGDYSNFEKSELLAQLAKTYDYTAESEKAKIAKQMLSKELASMKLSVQRPGEVLVAIGYMKDAGQKSSAVNWYQKLIQKFSKIDVYYNKLARYYMKEKEFDKALPLAEKAAKFSTDLALYNMKTLAEIHKNLKQNDKALQVVNKALSLPEAKLESSKKTVAGLEELKKSLQ